MMSWRTRKMHLKSLTSYSVAAACLTGVVSCGTASSASKSDVEAPYINVEGTSAGGFTLSGKAFLPPEDSSGREIQISFSEKSNPNAFVSAKSRFTTQSKEILFFLTGLTKGEYRIKIQIDSDGNGMFDEKDWVGYSGGSKTSAITRAENAVFVEVENRNVTEIEFAIARP